MLAPSTVGTFLRAFTFGHTRQLDHLTETALARAWAAGAGPVHARLRAGRANTARGMPRFCDELIARLRRAGASGELIFRAASGFWSAETLEYLRRLQGRPDAGIWHDPAEVLRHSTHKPRARRRG